MQVDHQLAHNRIRYGVSYDDMNDISNLFPSCSKCNLYKRCMTIESYRDFLKKLHTRVVKHYATNMAIKYGLIELHPWDGIFYFEKYIKDNNN